MSKVLKVKFNKDIATLQATSLEDLKANIYNIFYINPEKLRIIKPTLKTQQNFKALKQGIQILIMGVPQDKKIKQDPELKYIASLDQEQKMTYLQKKRGILEHAYKYDSNLGEVTYISASLHLFRILPQFRKYLKNPDKQPETLKMFAKDLLWQFQSIQDPKIQRPLSPIDFVFTFVSANEQLGQYPFQSHDPIWFFHFSLRTLQQGTRIVKSDRLRTSYNWITHHFMTKYNSINDDYEPIQDQPKRLRDKRITQKWWMVAGIADRSIINVKQAIVSHKIRPHPQQQEVFGYDVRFYQELYEILQIPPFILVHMERMELKSDRRVLQDPNLSDLVGRDFLKQNTHAVTYYKNIDFYDQCIPELQQQFQQGRKKRDQYFNPIRQSKQFKQFVKNLPNAKQLSQMQLLYAYKDSIMTDQQYDQFYGRQYDQNQKYKYRTGQYNLIGVITHKGQRASKSAYCRAFVQRSNKRWFRFDQPSVSIVPLDEVLSFRGNTNGNKNDEFAHMLLYKCIMWP